MLQSQKMKCLVISTYTHSGPLNRTQAFFLMKAGGAKNYSFINPDEFNDCILVTRAWF